MPKPVVKFIRRGDWDDAPADMREALAQGIEGATVPIVRVDQIPDAAAEIIKAEHTPLNTYGRE